MSEPTALDLLRRFRTDFEFYAPRCLKIRTKEGGVHPLKLNRAQIHLHREIERQLSEVGYVRMLGLKGRQQGFSTYTEGRLYWKASGTRGTQAFILTHEQAATDNLFAMTKRYHELCPDALRPSTANDNAKELYFDRLDTRFKVATAGARATGRSGTAQFFHGSEVAFWPNAADHMAGIGQTVPLLPDTEVILESTANGTGNLFHQMVMQAMRGEGDYRLAFVPWFWQDEYRRHDVPGSFILDDTERDYRDAFGLDDAQMYWRRQKIASDFAGDVNLFNQEYPGSVDLAFLKGSDDSLIPVLAVAKARLTRLSNESLRGSPLVLGVDPAEYGDDSTAIILRRGRKVEKIWRYRKKGPMELVAIVSAIIDQYRPDATNIDATGVGSGVCDRLRELGYAINRIHFGSSAAREDRYRNKRAEMWGEMKEWLTDGDCDLSETDDTLQSELTSVTYTYDSSRRLQLDSKEKMKKDGLPSPDGADALALTFAVRIAPKDEGLPEWKRQRLAMLANNGRRTGMTR